MANNQKVVLDNKSLDGIDIGDGITYYGDSTGTATASINADTLNGKTSTTILNEVQTKCDAAVSSANSAVTKGISEAKAAMTTTTNLWSGNASSEQTLTLSDSIDNYKLLIFCHGTSSDEWINSNTYPVEYFKTRNARSGSKSIILHNWDARFVCAYYINSTQICVWNFSNGSLRAIYGVK